MLQAPDQAWNAIAASQPLHEPWKTLFRMADDELIEGIHRLLDKTAEDAGADNKTVLAYRLTAPLLLENEAISAYIVATDNASLRTSLPELTSINEALMLASQEYRLNESQQDNLRQLLNDACTLQETGRKKYKPLNSTAIAALEALSKLTPEVRRRLIDREIVRQGNKQRAKDGRPLLKIPQPLQRPAPDSRTNQPEPAAPAAHGLMPAQGKRKADKAKAEADAIAELSDITALFDAPFKAHVMTPEQKHKLLPILTNLFDAAFRLGYIRFKDAAKWVLDKLRAAVGKPIADAVSLRQLQGAYIGMADNKPDADGIRIVGSVECKAEIEAHIAQMQSSEADGARSILAKI